VSRWPYLAADRACFVTLRKAGDLRGCIGSLEPRRSLIEDVRLNAVSAAVNDTRFQPVGVGELAEIDYEISILDRPRPLQGVTVNELPDWLGKNKPGLIIEYEGRRSTFLPSVWEDLPDPNQFLERLCRKQGSPGDCWRHPSTKLSVYGSIKFAEKDKD
jgi:AmmeMemoRadiSam system protein A